MARAAIFTHNDLDGLVSALLARLALPEAEVFFCDYHGLEESVRERLPRYDILWFTDLSLRDAGFFAHLASAAKDYYWFDHHISSQPQGFFRVCRIDPSENRCSADILRDYLVEQGYAIPEPLQTLVEYAHDQDLWLRERPEAGCFNDILGQMPVQELFQILEADPGAVHAWHPSMAAAAERTRQQRLRSIQLAESTVVCHDLGQGLRLKTAVCYGSASDVGEALGDAHTLVALWDLHDVGQMKPKFHFRTKSDRIDASRIAERLGGGGHPKASGAPGDLQTLQALSEAIAQQVLAVLPLESGSRK
jgi:oligoribonuclease NrnB/cAMP/cGMP phosphodiesterase (DHH superfamily)